MEEQVKTYRLSIIGAGRLGLALAIAAATQAEPAYQVMVMDVDEDRVQAINRCCVETTEDRVMELLPNSGIKATTDLKEALAWSQLSYVMVPTPDAPQGYDHSFLIRVLESIAATDYYSRGGHVVVGCTVLPGFMKTELAERASYSPLFVRQGKIIEDLIDPSLVLIGSRECWRGDEVERLHRAMYWRRWDAFEWSEKCRRVTPEEAEIAKLSVNSFLTMKIAFANLVADIAEATGANADTVLECVGVDYRIGDDCLKAGYGYGGPCLPRDNRALTVCAEDLEINPCMFVATDQCNRAHTRAMAGRLLAENRETYVFDSVSYKPDVTYLDESQQLQVAKLVAQAGRRVVINERRVVVEELQQRYTDLFEYTIRDQ